MSLEKRMGLSVKGPKVITAADIDAQLRYKYNKSRASYCNSYNR